MLQSSKGVELFHIADDGSRMDTIGIVPVGNESVSIDAFRCMPYGTFCLFTTAKSDLSGSFLYNVTASNATIISRTPIVGGLAHNVHVDHTTGGVYSVKMSPTSSTVVMILNGAVTPLVDITSDMNGTMVPPGGSTQCSDTNSMWIAAPGMDGAADRIIVVSLPEQKVQSTITLQDQLPASLWALCQNSNDFNQVGGAKIIGAQATYGHITSTGEFVVEAEGVLPEDGLVLTGLLSEPPGYSYYMALYPSTIDPSNIHGYLGFGDFSQSGVNPLKFSLISYYLVGSAQLN